MEYKFGKDKINNINLVLLVGSNPMPNYLLTEIFKPTKITLIFTEGTVTYKNNLKKVLQKKKWINDDKFKLLIDDNIKIEAKDPDKIFDDSRLKELFSQSNVHLNYTGGTKAMSSQIVRLFYETKAELVDNVEAKIKAKNEARKNASYLDDTTGTLYFDTGRAEPIDNMELNVSLEDIWNIHGFGYKNENGYWKKVKSNEKTVADCEEDINEILNKNNMVFEGCCEDGKLNSKLMNLSWLDEFAKKMVNNEKLRDCIYFILTDGKDGWKKIYKGILDFCCPLYNAIHFEVKDENKYLSCQKIDSKIKSLPFAEKINDSISNLDDKLNKYKKNVSYEDYNKFWCSFFTGGWFEVWIERMIIRKIVSNPEIKGFTEIHRSVHCFNSGDKPEIDLCFVVGRKLFMFSITTDSNLRICKNKLFEIAIRAKQIGGDHVRTAFVSLINDKNKKQMKAYLDTSLNEAGFFSVCPEIYGLSDVKNWIEDDGKVDSLLKFFKGEI